MPYFKSADVSNYAKAQSKQKAHNLVHAVEEKLAMYEQLIDIADDETVDVLLAKLNSVAQGLRIS